MKSPSRKHVVSSFTIVKGALIEETYAVFAAWDFTRSKRQNLDRLRETNFIGASSVTWLRDVAKVINRRFDPDGRDRALITLAKANCGLEEWKPLLLWHMTRDEFLVRDFLQNWLFVGYNSGGLRARPEDVEAYLGAIGKHGGSIEHAWSEHTTKRVAGGLLKIAVDFGLLRGGAAKEFTSYHLPDRSFLYLLHAIRDEVLSPRKVIEAPDWRMFLMRPADVEQGLLRLHQFRKLEFELAGTLVQLSLPKPNALAYAEKSRRMSDFSQRLRRDLEPILAMSDPREKLSAYHDMPYAIFHYDPEEEFALRRAVTDLGVRLENKGKRITRISLAECLDEAMKSEGAPEDWFENERTFGAEKAIEEIHKILAERRPLVDMVAARMPTMPDPKKDLVFIIRTGALFPVYRTFSLLEQLKGRVVVPTILFYPGDLDGAAGLRFMGVLDAEHNYRPKIF